MEKIRKAGALILKDKKCLIVRPKDNTYFLTPGGKYEKDETTDDCLRRELKEELQVEVVSFTHHKDYYFENTPRKESSLSLELYMVEIVGEASPSSEIEEIQWMSKEDFENKKFNLAPSFYTVVPDLIKDRLI